MNNNQKLNPDGGQHMEKQNFTEPQEEFVADQSIPSKSMQSERSEPSSSPKRAQDVKPGGHLKNKAEVFEPGVDD